MKKFFTFILGVLLGIGGFIFVMHNLYNMHITAVFEELEPFPHNLNVYYKGFKLGRSVRVHPTKDFTRTQVEMILKVKDLSLPDNITAKVRTKDKKDFIELEYPDAPSVTYLKTHSVIKGKKGVNISSFIDTQADSGGLDEVKENLNETVQSAGETFKALTDLFVTANEILKDLHPSLKQTGDNFVVMSANLAETSKELNEAVRSDRLNNTFGNIEQTTLDIERAARNLETASLNFSMLTGKANSNTIMLVDCIAQNTNTVVKNVNTVVLNINDIINGLKLTLSKRFGTMRMFFGKAIADTNCVNK